MRYRPSSTAPIIGSRRPVGDLGDVIAPIVSSDAGTSRRQCRLSSISRKELRIGPAPENSMVRHWRCSGMDGSNRL
ncbi:Uncharacterised protein [Mycobacteroides abscessus subsp. abscessus]|nr:Uncharacterised protein [Mycobacteroides abscessus subsp. abscessus]SKV29959.1 Uncharacterised protein [Mycobacteroides abscessus subsp. abscessus]